MDARFDLVSLIPNVWSANGVRGEQSANDIQLQDTSSNETSGVMSGAERHASLQRSQTAREGSSQSKLPPSALP